MTAYSYIAGRLTIPHFIVLGTYSKSYHGEPKEREEGDKSAPLTKEIIVVMFWKRLSDKYNKFLLSSGKTTAPTIILIGRSNYYYYFVTKEV